MAFDPVLLQKCWFLAGPTAVGKTAVSLHLAKELQAEIISMDSMSLYRGMDIGTAKPSEDERQHVPHHMIDVIDPSDEYSLAEYLQAAESIAHQIVARNQTPLFVGGTGLYLRGLLRGVFDGPPADIHFREELDAIAERDGSEHLHKQLKQVDPITARVLHPNDLRRIVRALEVFYLTGEPISNLQQQKPLPLDERPEHVYWLEPPRSWLHQRINQRVELMIETGLITETKSLLSQPKPLSKTAAQALGYKEVIDYLQHHINLEICIDLIKTRTRQFSKRQQTWFRNLEECQSVPVEGTASTEQQVELLLRQRR